MGRGGESGAGRGTRVSSRSCRASSGRGQLRRSSSCFSSSSSSCSPPPAFPPHLARPGLPRPGSRSPAWGAQPGGTRRGAAAGTVPLLAASLPNRRSPASGEGAREPRSHLLAAGEDSRVGLGCPILRPHLPAGRGRQGMGGCRLAQIPQTSLHGNRVFLGDPLRSFLFHPSL